MDFFLPRNTTASLSFLIKHYYDIKPKLKYGVICNIINDHHGITLTLRQLKEFLNKNSLNRARNVDDQTLDGILLNEIGLVSDQVGYRQMTEIISMKYGINVSRDTVRKALKRVDPKGVEARRIKVMKRRVYMVNGPMDVVHIDGNDKLKKYGFAIHGGIDGFSRKLLWLVVSTTNNCPLVVGNYYLNFISRVKRAPNTLRMDLGTENIYCEDLQVFFTNDDESFLYAKSTRNQRIEAFWSRLKKFNLKWWIEFFEQMIRSRIFKPSSLLHKELLLFCFLPVLQAQLNECLWRWNKRFIRQSATAPGGIPDILFNLPSTIGYTQQGFDVNDSDISVAKNVIGINHHPVSKDDDLHELLLCYRHVNNYSMPQDVDTAMDLYINLLSCLAADGFQV